MNKELSDNVTYIESWKYTSCTYCSDYKRISSNNNDYTLYSLESDNYSDSGDWLK